MPSLSALPGNRHLRSALLPAVFEFASSHRPRRLAGKLSSRYFGAPFGGNLQFWWCILDCCWCELLVLYGEFEISLLLLIFRVEMASFFLSV